jgi:hypothetical protein
MHDYAIDQEFVKKLRASIILLINLTEEAEEEGMSLDSIKGMERNLEELTGLLIEAKEYALPLGYIIKEW